MQRRHCSGTMSGGTRECYFKATVPIGSRWYCRKCARMQRAKVKTSRPPPAKPSKLPVKDLNLLYINVMKCKRKGSIDPHSAREIVLNILPMVLDELYQLRGQSKPKS